MRAMDSLERYVRGKLADLEARSLKRELAETARFPAGATLRSGRDMISFCCNDYLDLSHHPNLIEAAIDATRKYGAGSGASWAMAAPASGTAASFQPEDPLADPGDRQARDELDAMAREHARASRDEDADRRLEELKRKMGR